MTALGEWLKQLILIVMLSVFADLLLPTKAMQKYVRVVLGLAIIAAMLQPILPFFRPDWVDHVAASLTSTITNDATGGRSSQGDVGNVNVNRLKETLAIQQQSQANEIIAAQVSAMVENQFSCAVNHVDVAGASQDPKNINLHVFLDSSGASGLDDIRNWLSKQLHVPLSQIVVTNW